MCLLTDSPMPLSHIRAEGKAGSLGARLMAIVTEGPRGRMYLPPDEEHEHIAQSAQPPENVPDTDLPEEALGFRVQNYGMTKHRHLFTNRQLVALTTFCNLVGEAREKVLKDSDGEQAYADAVATYLAFAVDKMADTNSTVCTWQIDPPRLRATFSRQAIPMTWDYAEANTFGKAAGDYALCWESLCEVLDRLVTGKYSFSHQLSAFAVSKNGSGYIFSTDPPYYDNVPYADLSDYFYVWLRRSLSNVYPHLLGTVLVPKAEELGRVDEFIIQG